MFGLVGRWWLVWIAPCAACAVAATIDDAGSTLDAGGKDVAAQQDASTTDVSVKDSSTSDVTDSGIAVETGSGFASLQVNEVAPNVTGSTDLIELLAVTGGDIGGITVEQDITTALTLATLPSLVVATGDYIVVHLNAPVTVTDETASKTDCTGIGCYSGAWDIVGGATGITYSGRVIVTRGADAGVQDGVAFYSSSAISPATFYQQVEAIQDAGAWLPTNCGGNPCSTNALAQVISVNWVSAGMSSAKSIARTANADTNKLADWALGTSSFGLTNP